MGQLAQVQILLYMVARSGKFLRKKKRFFKVGEIYDSQRDKGKVDFFYHVRYFGRFL